MRAGTRLSDSGYRQPPTWNSQAPSRRRRRNYRGSHCSAYCTQSGLPPTRANGGSRLPMGLVSLLAKLFIRRTEKDGPATLYEAAKFWRSRDRSTGTFQSRGHAARLVASEAIEGSTQGAHRAHQVAVLTACPNRARNRPSRGAFRRSNGPREFQSCRHRPLLDG